MINWNNLEYELGSYFGSQRAKSEQEAAKYIAETYDRYVKLGKTQYGNSILSSVPKTFETFIYLGLMDARNGKNLQRTSQRISQGIVEYWRNVTMQITIPPPGSIQTVTNVITFSGILINISIRNTQNVRLLPKTLTLGFKTHIQTITGINTALVPIPSGGTVPTPFPWTGIR